MKLSNKYVESRDIDWFAVINGKYIHVASAGGNLPKKINDRMKLIDEQAAVHKLPFIYEKDEIVVNEELLRKEKHLENIEAYIESFVYMARKGFISFDRTNITDHTDSMYHIVCYPQDIKTKDLRIGLDLLEIKVNVNVFDTMKLLDIVEIIDKSMIHIEKQ